MKHFLIAIAFVFAISTITFSQDSDTLETSDDNNYVSLELGGSSFFYSLNYEHSTSISKLVRFNFGVGFSFIRVDFWNAVNVFTIPIKLGLIIGRNQNKIETGIGFTQAFTNLDPLFVPNTYVNYRFEGGEGFLFTAGLVGGLILEKISDNTYVDPLIWPKFGFGYSW